MYHRPNSVNQRPLHDVDLFSLKKKDSQTTASYQNNQLFFANHQTSVLTILGFFQFASGTHINQNVFQKANFGQIPKIFHNYGHQKTMKALLNVLVSQFQSTNSLVEFFNDYPIISFVLDAYCRATCGNYIKNSQEILLFGNQNAVLDDYSLQIRGNLLQILAQSLNFQVSLEFNGITEVYGQDKNYKKVNIHYSKDGIYASLNNKKGNYLNSNNKTNQNSGTKILKQIPSLQTQTSQSLKASMIQGSTLLRQSLVSESLKCQKCRLIRAQCICSKKVFNSPYNTPKSATKYEKTVFMQSSLNLNSINVTKNSKCACSNKILCVCRK